MLGMADKENRSRMICDGPTSERLFRLGKINLGVSEQLENKLSFIWMRDRNNRKYREMMGGNLRSISLHVRLDMELKPFVEERV